METGAERKHGLTSEEIDAVRDFIQRKQSESVRERLAAAAATTVLPPASGPNAFAAALPKIPSGWAAGFKSTEFLTAVAGVVLAIAKGYGYNIPEDAFWSIVAYIIGRSGMKAAAAFRSGVKQ